jgi:hypothetical protein
MQAYAGCAAADLHSGVPTCGKGRGGGSGPTRLGKAARARAHWSGGCVAIPAKCGSSTVAARRRPCDTNRCSSPRTSTAMNPVAARYCYGGSLEITTRDVAPLRCAAALLDAPDLARRAEDFLAQAALRSLPGATDVLRSCEALLPGAGRPSSRRCLRRRMVTALRCHRVRGARPGQDSRGARPPCCYGRRRGGGLQL